MCFGNNQQTQSQTNTPSPWVTGAAMGNLDWVRSLMEKGFQPYNGQFVSPFSGQQQSSFGQVDELSNSSTPFGAAAPGMIFNAANAPVSAVRPQSIASNMSPYMNQYVDLALKPQMEQLKQQFAGQNKSFDSAATGSGAFGDTGWGLGRTNLTQQQDTARTGVIGNAYNAAFNTAIGAGAQDVSNKMNAQITNAANMLQKQRDAMAGGQSLWNIATGGATLQNQFGGQQTAASQADLNARYNQYLMAQQYPLMMAQLMNQTIGAANPASPSTQTTSNPNNMGYGLLGSLLGGAGSGLGAYLGLAAFGLAEGGPAAKGDLHIVGEKGPELFVPVKHYQDGGMIGAGQPSIVGEAGPEGFVPGDPNSLAALYAALNKAPAPMQIAQIAPQPMPKMAAPPPPTTMPAAAGSSGLSPLTLLKLKSMLPGAPAPQDEAGALAGGEAGGMMAIPAARGGPAKKGKLHIVGEEGPELFVPIPNKKSKGGNGKEPRKLASGTLDAGLPSVIGGSGPQFFRPNQDGIVIPNDLMQSLGFGGGGNFDWTNFINKFRGGGQGGFTGTQIPPGGFGGGGLGRQDPTTMPTVNAGQPYVGSDPGQGFNSPGSPGAPGGNPTPTVPTVPPWMFGGSQAGGMNNQTPMGGI